MYNKRRYKNEGKKFKVKGDPERFLAKNERTDAGAPNPKSQTVDMGFQTKAFRDITQGSISIAINPAGEISRESEPYAVINRSNSVVDAKYRGRNNQSGSIVPSLAEGTTSTFRNTTDLMTLLLDVNYGYCKFSESDNADPRMNKAMFKPYNSVLETIRSEAYTDLPFFGWKVEGTTYSEDGLLELMLSYQSVVQQVHLVAQNYINIRSLEKHLKDMCFDGDGASKLNDMFGRIKKAAFVNMIKGIADDTIYFYTDANWWKQVNMLLSIPCRKSNSMVDPLLVIIPHYHINQTLVVKNREGEVLFDMQNANSMLGDCVSLSSSLNPHDMLKIARNPNTTTSDITNWFNNMVNLVGSISSKLDRFVKQFKEMHTAFKRLSNMGITEWKPGLFVAIENINSEYQPKFNKLVYDIFRSSCTGSATIQFNTKIHQWVSCSLWDLFLGIPTYDYMSGGCTLTFSTHAADRPAETPSTVIYPALYKTLSTGAGQITCLTRSNYIYYIGPQDITFSDSVEFSRLIPLTSYDNMLFKCPHIARAIIHNGTTYDIQSENLPAEVKHVISWAMFTMAKIFGYLRVNLASGHTDSVENDSLCFIDVVIDDQSNAAKSFCRAHSPFRTVKTTLKEELGFEVSSSIAAFRQQKEE